jgi:putative membrane protein
MILEFIIALLLGISAGVVTGLIPGIHINLVGIILVAIISKLFLNIQDVFIIAFIVAMAITHTFLDFIPSILLGCPDTDTELSILPGHEMLKNGESYEAIALTAYGSLMAIVALAILTLPTIYIMPLFENFIKNSIAVILIIVIMILGFSEKNKFSAFFVIFLTGTLGLIVLNMENISEPLLPLLTGLFGGSTLIKSIRQKIKIPPQKIINPKLKIKPIFPALFAAPLCSFLPGLGSGQAAIIGNLISREGKRGFLTLLGATNTLVMGFSFISLYAIGKTRTGAAQALKKIIFEISPQEMFLIPFFILIAGLIAFILTLKLAEKISQTIELVNYTYLSTTILILISIIVLIFSKPFGFFIFIVATLTGYYCIDLPIRRSNMMGVLMLPVIFWYIF